MGKPRVVLIYRSAARGGFSIENVFSSIASRLSREAEVTEYFLTSKWGSIRDIVRLLRLRADVYHITGDVHYLALVLPRRKVVLTVHDTYYLQHGVRGLKRFIYRLVWFQLPLCCAERVTAISTVTRDSLAATSSRVMRKTRVIPDPVHPDFVPRANVPTNAKPRLLFIGTAEHKNLTRTISAIQHMDCELVIIGSLSKATLANLFEAGIEYSNLAGLEMSQVYEQYCQADVLVFPSLREGFGLPILEAQAVGVPVVTSSLPPMNEIAGEGACLVDPYDVESIGVGISRVIADSDYRDGLVAGGRENVTRYSADAVATEFLSLYHEMVMLTLSRMDSREA